MSLVVNLAQTAEAADDPLPSSYTLTVPLPDNTDLGKIRAQATELNNRNPLLSDTIYEDRALNPVRSPGGQVAVEYDFDGTLSVTGTSLSLTITPVGAQAASLDYWQNIILVGASLLLGWTTRILCEGALAGVITPVFAAVVCVALGNFIAAWIPQAVNLIANGQDANLGDWALALGLSLLAAGAGAVWEGGGNVWARTVLPGHLRRMAAWLVDRGRSFGGWFRPLGNGMENLGEAIDLGALDFSNRLADRMSAGTAITRTNLRVMPLGDSITVGYGGDGDNTETYVGYRRALLSQLRADGHPVDFVGFQNSGAGRISDTDHEGHGGWRIEQIDRITECSIRRWRPNVVTLHVGTNDMNQNYDAGTAPARLTRLIRKITDIAPETTVLVSRLVPSTDAAINARIQRYNGAIPTIALTLAAEGRRVRALGMDAIAATSADMNDRLHPNQAGYDKMAGAFSMAINGAIHDRVIAAPVAGDTGPCDVPPPPSPSAGWNHITQINAGYGYLRDWVRLADMNGDNRDDYVVLQDLGQVRAWLNDGDGQSWTWRGELNPGYGYPRDWVRFADMDGDGRDDYVILQDLGQVRVWRNNGPGKEWTWQGEVNPGYGYPRDWVRLADINGDGLDDYVIVQDEGQLRVWLNNGPGKGWTWQGEVNPGYGYPRDWVRLADINADKKVDYLVVQDNGQVRAWLNDLGGRGWIWQGAIIGDVGVDRGNVRLADVNGDRKADYLGIGPLGQLGAWINDRYPGGPTPGNPPDDPGPEPGSPSAGWNHITQINAGYGYLRDWVRLADMNGDNRDDYVVLQDLGQVRAWLNDGDGQSWTWRGELNPGYGYPRDWVRFADMDGDGRDDYVILQDLGQVRVWLNDGDGQSWTWKGELNPGYGYPRDWVRLADINGDGLDDYVILQDLGQVRVWLNNGPGKGWTWQGEVNPGYGYPRDWVRLADINGDKKVDYLVVQDNGQVRAWLNDLGGRGWIWQGAVIGDVGVDRGNVRLADVNGDRKADYLGIGPLGQLGAWINNRYSGG
ncbi:FG-GAP-like repeat-containing protein [Sphaerisporangium melleum]|uniref:FG-GAP-like repeat-containing protein n=4 Tax=Sphaerisporangium melleum TaxID=321316 RepID=UPI00194FF127|nr:FG-GAP-like repeat-containing protein [Sphaerisporangium melleum]